MLRVPVLVLREEIQKQNISTVLGNFPQTQVSLLKQAEANVKPGGLLFYAVCTITPEETSNVIEEFLNENGFSLLQLDDFPHNKYLLKNNNGLCHWSSSW